MQMRRLAFFVVGKRKRDVGQAIKRQFAIGFWIVDWLVLRGFFGRIRIVLAVLQRAQQRKAR